MTTSNATNAHDIAADVCLYGTRERGFDYLASVPTAPASTPLGASRAFTPGSQPDPCELRFDSLTTAIWAADHELSQTLDGHIVRIFAPGGERYTDARIGSIPSAGSLAWVRVPA